MGGWRTLCPLARAVAWGTSKPRFKNRLLAHPGTPGMPGMRKCRIPAHCGLSPCVCGGLTPASVLCCAARSLKTLSSQIYSATTRILYEIIQNADDCNFDESEARAAAIRCLGPAQQPARRALFSVVGNLWVTLSLR